MLRPLNPLELLLVGVVIAALLVGGLVSQLDKRQRRSL